MDCFTEPEKRVPVVRNVDVVVAGSGITGMFAALGAAKAGAKVLLVERFGTVGGNIGPAGYICGYKVERDGQRWLRGEGFPQLIEEFFDRYGALLGDQPRNYATMSHAVAHVAFEMLEELGVETMLSAYASDPAMDGNRVAGLFVETKSGRVAVGAKVVIDATGDASIASRAGAPVRHAVSVEEVDSPNLGSSYMNPEESAHDDTNLFVVVAGSDWVRYRAWRETPCELTAAEQAWADKQLRQIPRNTGPLLKLYHEAWKSGEFRCLRTLRKNLTIRFGFWFPQQHYLGPGLTGLQVAANGEYNSGDWEDISMLEQAMRRMAYEGVAFFREHVPGFRDAYIVMISPFLGSRGGPFIDAEHLLTPQESFRGFQPADSLYLTTVEVHRRGNRQGHGMPYRMLLPRQVEGLLVTGRGAGFLRRGHDPSTRARANMLALGEATGIAAGMSARDSVAPRDLDIKKLQRRLLKEGFFLGTASRLKRLGLA